MRAAAIISTHQVNLQTCAGAGEKTKSLRMIKPEEKVHIKGASSSQ